MSAPDPNAKPSLAEAFAERDLVLVGCGKMGGALLEGWLDAGAPPQAITVVEPQASPELTARLSGLGARVVAEPTAPSRPVGALVLAVKPQIMAQALPPAIPLIEAETLVVSVAAGLPIAFFEQSAPKAAVLRTMPNTPAAIGQGVTALIANAAATPAQKILGEALAAVVGEVVWLEREDQMDAVTGLSGSGPAYVFHMIEALAEAGAAEGLPADLAMRLARATVSGAGALAAASGESPATLRKNVTSPGGTTAAGLEALMDPAEGLTPLMTRTVAAAAARSRELAKN